MHANGGFLSKVRSKFKRFHLDGYVFWLEFNIKCENWKTKHTTCIWTKTNEYPFICLIKCYFILFILTGFFFENRCYNFCNLNMYMQGRIYDFLEEGWIFRKKNWNLFNLFFRSTKLIFRTLTYHSKRHCFDHAFSRNRKYWPKSYIFWCALPPWY